LRSTFLLLASMAIALAQDPGQALKLLTDQDPKGMACGAYFRIDSGNLIYHLRTEEKSASQPLDYIVKIVLDDKALSHPSSASPFPEELC
jgi:hypothetical protein